MRHLDDGTLQAWLDVERGELTAPERDDIARHLAACEACATRLEELGALDDRARELLGAEGAGAEGMPDFEQIVVRAGRGGNAARRRSAWTAAAWAATVVLAVAVGWLVRGAPRQEVAMATGQAPEPGPAPAAAAPAAKEGGRIEPAEPRTKAAAPRAKLADAPAPTVAAAPAPPPNADVALKTKQARRSAAGASPSEAFASAPAMQARAVAGATAPAVVRGRVMDESGRPLASAQVVANGRGEGALTDADGRFSLSLARPRADSVWREVTVTARLLGYAPASRTLPVPAADTGAIDLRLAQDKVSLNAVVVSGAGAREDVAASRESRVDSYRSAAIDANGNLAIVTESGEKITVRKEAGQTSFSAPVISPSRTAVGAQAMFPSCCTSYDLPLQLVIYAGGEAHRLAGDSLPIFRWAFVDRGARVAYGQAPAHFGCSTHYELRDVESDGLIDAVDVPEPCGSNPSPKPVKVPAWVAELTSRK